MTPTEQPLELAEHPDVPGLYSFTYDVPAGEPCAVCHGPAIVGATVDAGGELVYVCEADLFPDLELES